MGLANLLEIRLLGQANVSVGGVPVKFSRRATTLAMLAFLILRRGRPIARASLAFMLFPDYVEGQALDELRRYLYLAGKALPPPESGEPWLTVDAETVAWNVACDAFVDVVEFERLAADASTLPGAVELYAGDLLENIYDDWVVVERERLRGTYLRILGELVERHRSARDYPRAIAYAGRLLAADAWREDVVRQLMAIRYASGDTPGALAEFESFAKRLGDEMGVAPMAETLAVRESILRDRPLIGSVDRASGDSTRRPHAGAHALPFVGRETELAHVRSCWDRAARGFGNAVFIGGEAGIGKTRLLGEIARVVESEGGRVYSGGTSAPESSPYQSIVEALRAAVTVLTGSPALAATIEILAPVFPEFEPEPGARTIARLAPDREAARLFEAFATAVGALASPRPALVVLEDLHWASASTIDALATICRRIDRARVLVVGTYRDEETSGAHPLRRLVNALGVERRMTDVHLRRFERAEVARMIGAVDALPQANEELVDRLYAFSEGNALFVHEAIADMIDRPHDSDAVPSLATGIADIVASRIGRLGERARAVAEIAAVCGHGCSVDVVRDVAGFSVPETLDAFGELLDRHLIREAGARERFDYVFTHSLIGTSIYERMSESRRTRRHARIARVTERGGEHSTRDVRELARHFELGGLREAAGSWYARASREAAALYAHDDAVRFATRALDFAEDDAATIEALSLREEANAPLGLRDAQTRDLERLRPLARRTDERCRVLERTALLLRSGDDRMAETEIVAALRCEAALSGDSRWIGIAAGCEARLLTATGHYGDARTLARAALENLEGEGLERERIDVLSALAETETSLGNFDEAERILTVVSEIATDVGDLAASCSALMRTVSAAMLKQEFERAARLASEALANYRTMGDRVGEARALSNFAAAAVRLSRWSQARAANESALEIFETVGDRWGVARSKMTLATLFARCGDFTNARVQLVAAREHHAALGDRRAIVAAFMNESFVALWQGEPHEAKDLASRAVAVAREMDHAAYVATALANLGAAERDLGELDAAIAHMEEGLALQVSLNRMSDGVSDLADVALAYAMRGDLATGRAYAERVLAVDPVWTRAAVFPPHPVWVVACILHWDGDDRAARVRDWARDLTRSLAESIDDAALRATFEALPFVAAIARAGANDDWPARPGFARAAHGGAVR